MTPQNFCHPNVKFLGAPLQGSLKIFFHSACIMTFPFSAANFGLGAKSTWSIGISTEGFYLSGFCRQVSSCRRATDTGCVKALGWCVAIKSLLTFLLAMQSAGSATKRTVCSSAVINLMKVLKKWGESHRQHSWKVLSEWTWGHSAACINCTKMKCPIWNWWHLLLHLFCIHLQLLSVNHLKVCTFFMIY